MSSSLPVAVGLILVGAAIMAAAIVLGLAIRKDVSRALRPRWLVIVSLMVFFLLGYVGLVLMIVLDVSVSRDIIVGAIFFGGACFVYLVMSLTRASLADIRRRTDSLIEVNEELEREIAERTRAEEGLRYSESYLRSIIDTEPECVMLLERDGTVRAMNAAGLEMLEASGPQDVIGARIHGFLSPGHGEPFLAFMEQVFRGQKGSLQFKVMGFKAGERWLETHAVPFRDEQRRETLMLAVARDITERWTLEQQLQQAQKMEALGTLTGGVAHEFNNVITAILGFGELLRDDIEQGHPLRAYVDYIVTSAERAARLTEGLLAFSRKQMTNPEPVDINRIIRVTEGLLSRFAGETIELTCRTSSRSLPVVIDRAQMEQALVNLATNAIDAMPRGGRLSITSEHVAVDSAILEPDGEVPAGQYALITVTDTGSGMDEETLKRVFDPFFTTKEVGRGTGLGLSMVYGTVKRHGGHILVRSAPGQGTTFRIYLPISQAQPAEKATGEAEPRLTGSETVLIAEDDDNVRNFLSRALAGAGYRTIAAVDGVDAVEKFRAQGDGVDLLLFDLVMPRRNGKEAYEEIARLRPGVKAVFISGYERTDIRTRELVNAGHVLISKPVSPRDILARVRESLDSSH